MDEKVTPEPTTKPSLPADLLADIIADLPEADKALLTKIKERLLGVALEVMPVPEPKKAAKEIESIADLQQAIDELFQVEINFQGKDFLIKGRRLRPNETAALEEIRNRPVPQVQRGKTQQEDRYLYDDPAYIKAKTDAEITCRALAVYWCFPVVAKGKENLKDPKDIRDYVQGLWNDAILQALYTVTNDGGVRKAAYTNFI